jgi:ABC-type transport system involved in cytochrome bd biosynthesis fused ATPase/permease subunit
VANLNPAPSPGTDLQRAARQIGAFNSLIGMGLAVATAKAVADLAAHQIDAGLWALIAVLISRCLLVLLIDEWNNHASRLIRAYWRANLLGHMVRPRREGERSRGDLAVAIDRASEGPALISLQISAQVGVLGIVVIFWAAGWLACLVTIALLLFSVPLYVRAGKRSEALSTEYHQRRALLESRQLELLQHAPELRALGAVSYGAQEIAAISDSEHRVALRAIRVALESSLVTEFLSGVSIGLVAMVVGFGLLGGRISLFHALVGVLMTGEVFLNVRRYGGEFHRREEASDSLSLLGTLEKPMVHSSAAILIATDLVSPVNEHPVSLTVSRASRILVTGPSGSGKTTLLHTLLGWREARQGVVERSGGAIGLVSVESQLLSGSLWGNLTLGAALEPSVVFQQLVAVGLAGDRFSDLDTLLLADGRGLSDGERVRLVLARCLLASPELLIIDDIAGVLDEQSRQSVKDALGQHPDLAIIEATVDQPLLANPSQSIALFV